MPFYFYPFPELKTKNFFDFSLIWKSYVDSDLTLTSEK